MSIVDPLERSQFCRDHGTPAFVEMPAHQIPAEDVPQRVGADKRLAVAAQHFFIGKADLDQGAISVPAIENLALVQHELVREPLALISSTSASNSAPSIGGKMLARRVVSSR